MQRIFYTVLIVLSLCSHVFSQNEKIKQDPILDSIARSIRSNENLTLEWETSFAYGKERVKDVHTAKIKGHRYYHKLKATTIICDGESVYRRSAKSNEVTISGADTTADYNPIKLLTFFGSGFQVKKLRKDKETGRPESISIETIAPEANVIRDAVLYFDTVSGMLSAITFRTNSKSKNYVKIKKFDSVTLLADSDFVIPK